MIYVITVGEYEDTYIYLATTSLDLAVKTILKQSSEDVSYFSKFNTMECWKDNELVLDYGMSTNHKITYQKNITYEILREELVDLLNNTVN